MSIRAWSLVWERTRAKGSNLLMLLAIGDYAKDDGGWAWPSPRTLTKKTRLTERGGELVLTKLVLDREIAPEWDAATKRLYLHIRCIRDWAAYQTEGPAAVTSEKISHKQSEKFSLKLVKLALAAANQPTRRAKTATGKAKTAAGSLLSGSVSDPSRSLEHDPRADPPLLKPVENSDGRPDRAGAPRRSAATDEDPNEHVRVITKIVHEVLDLLAEADDVTEGDVIDAVKRHCAVLDIAYRSDVVWSALASALYQRQRIGKPSPRFPRRQSGAG